MRKLTNEEIKKFASRDGAKNIAVEKFLGSMGTDVSDAIDNLILDAKLYKWNKETTRAIFDGIGMATGLEEI